MSHEYIVKLRLAGAEDSSKPSRSYMRKLIYSKKAAIIGSIIFLLLLIVLPYFVSLNHYKASIQNALHNALGQDLEVNIKRDIKIRILPYPHIILEEVSVRYKRYTVIRANTVEVNISLSLLLGRELVSCINSLTLRNGVAAPLMYWQYLRERNGSINKVSNNININRPEKNSAIPPAAAHSSLLSANSDNHQKTININNYIQELISLPNLYLRQFKLGVHTDNATLALVPGLEVSNFQLVKKLNGNDHTIIQAQSETHYYDVKNAFQIAASLQANQQLKLDIKGAVGENVIELQVLPFALNSLQNGLQVNEINHSDTNQIKGNLLIDIMNMKTINKIISYLYNKKLPSESYDKENYDINDIAGTAELLRQGERFSFSTDLIMTDKHWLYIGNMAVKHRSVQNLQGELLIDISDWPLEIWSSIKVGLVDLDSLLLTNKLQGTWQLILATWNSLQNIWQESNTLIDINIEEMIINQGKITNIDVGAGTFGGNLLLDHIKASLPGGGNLNAHGYIAYDDIRTKFNGFMKVQNGDMGKILPWLGVPDVILSELPFVKGNKFEFVSDLDLALGRAILSNIHLHSQTDNLQGRVVITQEEEQGVGISASITSEMLDLDRLGLGSLISKAYLILQQTDSDRSGESYFQAVHNHLWLRQLQSNWQIELQSDNAVLLGQNLNDLHSYLIISPGSIKIDRLKFNSDFLEMNGNFSFSLPTFRPYIETNLHFSSLHLPKLSKIVSSYIENAENLSPNNNGVNKAVNNQAAPNNLTNNALKAASEWNFLSLANYDGVFQVTYDNIYDEVWNMQDGLARGRLKDGALILDEARTKMAGGAAGLVGYAIIKQNIPQFNIALNAYNINPGLFFQKLTGLNTLDGRMSLSAKFDISGSNWRNSLESMEGEMLFYGRRIYWSGFSLDEVVKITDSSMNTDAKVDAINKAFSTGISSFDRIEGVVKIKDGIATLNEVKMNNSRVSGSYVANYSYMDNVVNGIALFSFIPVGSDKSVNIELSGSGQLPSGYKSQTKAEQLADFLWQQKNVVAAQPVAPSQTKRRGGSLRGRFS